MIRQQQWARTAFGKVLARRGAPGGKAAEKAYASECRGGPALIRQSGLLQAVAFLRSRGRAESQDYANDLAVVLGFENSQILQGTLQTANTSEYRRWSRDATAVAIWLRRFAQSELDQDDAPVTHAAR
jgi:CRISPR/Cas system CMR-associated protein Cmr5 small subunit